MNDKIQRLVGQLRIECELPTEEDLDWMETAVQRHTGGFDTWWTQNRDELSGRDWMQIFISVWESGRGAKVPNMCIDVQTKNKEK